MRRPRFNWRAYRKKRREGGVPVRKYVKQYWYLSPDLTKCWLTSHPHEDDPYNKTVFIKPTWLRGQGPIDKGDRVYLVWRGYIRGWVPVTRKISVLKSWYCKELDHQFPPGHFVVCKGPMVPCIPVPMAVRNFIYSHPWGERATKVPRGKKTLRAIRQGRIKPHE